MKKTNKNNILIHFYCEWYPFRGKLQNEEHQ